MQWRQKLQLWKNAKRALADEKNKKVPNQTAINQNREKMEKYRKTQNIGRMKQLEKKPRKF